MNEWRWVPFMVSVILGIELARVFLPWVAR